jgi:ring-1,2-phenylacetyl-CoA epoxidase subunit PaaE
VPAELRSAFEFRAGQYLTLRRRDGGDERSEERRSYSICVPEGAAPRIGVRRVPGGLFSEWLVDRVRPGDTVEVAAPTGRFTAEVAPRSRHVMVAAGSGITPVLSVLGTALAAHPDTEVTLLYGNRRTDTVMFAEELAEAKDRHGARLHLVHVLSREPTAADILSGRLDGDRLRTLLGALVPVPDVDHWWLCGPHQMITEAQRVLTGLGVPRARVHRELFYVDEPPPEPVRPESAAAPGSPSEVTVILDGRATTLSLDRDLPVLDAAQRARSDLPFACKSGVCGTCRARVTTGRVRMRRNFALEPDEIEAGYVLTCQAVPDSDSITVDYDAR